MTLNVALLLLLLIGALSSVAFMQAALRRSTDHPGHRHGTGLDSTL